MSKLSPHMYRYEFACKCGCGFDTVDAQLLSVSEAIREFIGPYSPSSACRCVSHNEKVQKEANKNYVSFSSKSKHLIGRAIDVNFSEPYKLYQFLDNLYPNTFGLGVYSWGIHIDTREEKRRWDRR